MRIDRTSSYNCQQSFGAIILRDKRCFPKELCSLVEEKVAARYGSRRFKSEDLAGKRLIDEVIKFDFNTPELQDTFKKLVESQKNNPVNVYVDLFTAHPPEIPLDPSGWYQKATVGKLTFKQPTEESLFFETASPISFLERACTYANILKFLGFKR